MKNTILLAAVALALAGCTTTQKVAPMQPMDASLSCGQLQAEFAKLDGITREADSNKGVTTANVAAAFIFPLAIVGNYLDADGAQKLVEQRRTNLMAIWNGKNCVAQVASPN